MAKVDDYFTRIEKELSGAYEGPGPLPVPYCQWLADFDNADNTGRDRLVYACAGLALHRAEKFSAAIEVLWQLHRKLRTRTAFDDGELTLEPPALDKMLGDLIEEFKRGRVIDGESYTLIDVESLDLWQQARAMRNDLCHGFFLKQPNLETTKGRRRACENLLRMAIFLEEATLSVNLMRSLMAEVIATTRNCRSERNK